MVNVRFGTFGEGKKGKIVKKGLMLASFFPILNSGVYYECSGSKSVFSHFGFCVKRI